MKTRGLRMVLGWVFSLLATAMLTGCSTAAFNREWKQAVMQPVPNGTLAGTWEGRWMSDANGHNGRLRCIMTKKSEDLYEAKFHATFWKVFMASYAVPFRINETNGWFEFEGESDLGFFAGGQYKYQGYATPTYFFSLYTSKYDRGTFLMERPSK